MVYGSKNRDNSSVPLYYGWHQSIGPTNKLENKRLNKDNRKEGGG